jgi:hypothetical protein
VHLATLHTSLSVLRPHHSHVALLQEQLEPHIQSGNYFIFDCPGQSELYMCHHCFQSVVTAMTKTLHMNLTAVQLVDSHLCTGPSKYLSAMLMCLTSMLHLELPHVNVLSKVGLVLSVVTLLPSHSNDFDWQKHDHHWIYSSFHCEQLPCHSCAWNAEAVSSYCSTLPWLSPCVREASLRTWFS